MAAHVKKIFFTALLLLTISFNKSHGSNATPPDNYEKTLQQLSDKQKQELVQNFLDAGLLRDRKKSFFSEPMLTVYILSLAAATIVCMVPCLLNLSDALKPHKDDTKKEYERITNQGLSTFT